MNEPTRKTPYTRVADAIHSIDDTMRDTIVYPSRSTVLGISELDNQLVLSFASTHDGDGPDATQVIWISTEDLEAMGALREAVNRSIARAAEKAQ